MASAGNKLGYTALSKRGKAVAINGVQRNDLQYAVWRAVSGAEGGSRKHGTPNFLGVSALATMVWRIFCRRLKDEHLITCLLLKC